MHWIAIGAAAACGFALPFGLGAMFDYQDTGDKVARRHSIVLIWGAVALGLVALVIGFRL